MIKKTTSPVLHIEAIGSGWEDDDTSMAMVLVVHEVGRITCLSGDLSTERWSSEGLDTLQDSERLGRNVVAATVATYEQAYKSIFKNRIDVLAASRTSRESSGSDGEHSIILTLVSAIPKRLLDSKMTPLNLHTFSINTNQSHYRPGTTALQEIITLPITGSNGTRSDKQTFSLHQPSGRLYQQEANSLSVYDIMSPVPKREHHIPLNSGSASFLPTSNSQIALASEDSLYILDAKHRSIQGSLSLPRSQPSAINGKTSPGSKHTRTKVQLLTYCTPSSIVIGLRGRNVVAFQLSSSHVQGGEGKKRRRAGLLVDSIGRGIGLNGAALFMTDSTVEERHKDQPWATERAMLDRYAKEDDTEAFDGLVLSILPVGKRPCSDMAIGTQPNPAVTGLVSTLVVDRLVSYLLSKIFAVQSGDTTYTGGQVSLYVPFCPPLTVRWLIDHGQLSADNVETALKKYGHLPVIGKLSNDALVTAVANSPLGLQGVLHIFKSPSYLACLEILVGLKLALRNTQKLEAANEVGLLTNGQSVNHEAMDLDSPSGKLDKTFQDSAILHDDHSTAEAILETSSNRLCSFHGSVIINSLQLQLSRADRLSLIDHLRLSLAKRGWLSRYGDPEDHQQSSNDSLSERNHYIQIASKLLNCVLDSLGLAGWETSDATKDNLADTEDTMAYMKAEVSAALEGIEEAAYLKGLLQEVLLHAKGAVRTLESTNNGDETSGSAKRIKSLIIRPADPAVSLMPLNYRASGDLSLTKIGAGGELQKRSRRDIGRLKSMQVGEYSFERILI
ncbi:hypothetical protein MMC09_004182 [Bachmanniomyces sp. S44760]|nr:hypothetical protein [Bachmanniomyces sp. S44760]